VASGVRSVSNKARRKNAGAAWRGAGCVAQPPSAVPELRAQGARLDARKYPNSEPRLPALRCPKPAAGPPAEVALSCFLLRISLRYLRKAEEGPENSIASPELAPYQARLAARAVETAAGQ